MDISEQKYRKIIQTFKPYFNNVIMEYPIPFDTEIPSVRNLKYIVEKEKYSGNLPFTLHPQCVDEIHTLLTNRDPETRMLGVRLARCLPFICRLNIIENNQNELNMIGMGKAQQKNNQKTGNQFNYEVVSDLCDLLLSVYELTSYSEDIYFDVNQKITSIFARVLQNCFSSDRNIARNSYEVLRTIFMSFGFVSRAESNMKNKLIRKILQIFQKQPSYQLQTKFSNVSSSASSFRSLVLRVREYEIRVRCRLLTGISYLATYLPETTSELYELIFNQLFIIIENANEFDMNLECFLSIRALLSIHSLKFDLKARIMKKWVGILSQLTYKKQYFQFYVRIIQEAVNCPVKLKYFISTSYLQITSTIQQQFSRFIIYKFACRNLMTIAHADQKYSPTKEQSHSIIINIFQYSWFIDRINEEGDLFRSQFLICLLHAHFTIKGERRAQQIHDLLGLCHRLLDWKCSCKEETHIPTIKFAFDLYLKFLKQAASILQDTFQPYVKELIDRCNEENIYFLFKYKLMATIATLDIYRVSIIPYSETKLSLNLLEGEIRPYMMPKNHKPIFDYEYSLSADGEIESRKQIQAIKVIMNLLSALQEVHKEVQDTINVIIIDYHQYLEQLEGQRTANKDLINCLQSLEGDHYFSECQRNFLLSLIDSQDTKGNNIQYTIDNNIVHSPLETYDCDEEINAFGTMSPVQLKIKVIGGRSFSSVFLQIRKNQWVGTKQMKLVVSSALETVEVPFESCIVEMKIDRIGYVNFQVWTLDDIPLLLGSASYRIKRKFQWMQLNHLSVIDGIRNKAFFKHHEGKDKDDSTYLTFFYGEPVLIQTIESKSEIVVSVSGKQIWQQMQEVIVEMVQELTEKSANIVQ